MKNILLYSLVYLLVFPLFGQESIPFPLSGSAEMQSKSNPYYLKSAQFRQANQSSEIGKHEKLELGFQLSTLLQDKIQAFLQQKDSNGINPFDPDQLNFVAEFQSPSGKKIKRFGFYYQAFKENKTFDRWEENNTDLPWRLRFAPDEIGSWKISISIHTPSLEKPISENLSFSCVPSQHKGRLKSSHKGDNADRYLYYEETGETFLSVSNNISSGGFITYKPSQNQRQMKGVQQLIAVGGNFTRFDMQPQAALPDWPIHNNYDGKQDEMFGFDRLVELCEKNGVYFIVFRHHVELLDSQGNPGGPDWSGASWYENSYRTGFNLNRKLEYLTNEEVLKWQLKSLRYVFSRWGYSPNFSFYGHSEINGWYEGIIKEEIKTNPNFGEKEGIAAFGTWFAKHQKYIKEELNAEMMIANSYSAVPEIERDSTFNGLLSNSDIIAIHLYETTKGVNFDWRAETAEYFWKRFKKPILIEEMGISDNKLRIYCCTGIEYHNSIWSTSLMGTVGTGMDWWWDRGVQDFSYHHDLEAIHHFFSKENLRDMRYHPAKWSDNELVNKRTIENFFLVSENKERALGWVHNATYYWRNLEKESPCIEELLRSGRLKYPCMVGQGYDINNEGPGDYSDRRYEDDFTPNGGALPIVSSTGIQDNPSFQLKDLKRSRGVKKHWYKVEFYSTHGQNFSLLPALTQLEHTNFKGSLSPHVPNLDHVNPDYSYKVSYLGKTKRSPQL